MSELSRRLKASAPVPRPTLAPREAEPSRWAAARSESTGLLLMVIGGTGLLVIFIIRILQQLLNGSLQTLLGV